MTVAERIDARPPTSFADALRRKIVLAVDDDEVMLELMVATIRRGTFQALSAGDGEQALRLARTCRPDLILLDGAMPGMNGFEVCQRLKADRATRDIPVIMLTALAQPEDRGRALAAGADDFVTKPFGPLALIQRLRRALAG